MSAKKLLAAVLAVSFAVVAQAKVRMSDPWIVDARLPAVAYGRDQYLVVWDEFREEPWRWALSGAFVDRMLVKTTTTLTIVDPTYAPRMHIDLSSDGLDFLVVWLQMPSGGRIGRTVHARIVLHTGEPAAQVEIAGGEFEHGPPSVTFDGTNYLVVWSDALACGICGQYVSRAGQLVGEKFQIVDGGAWPRVASDGSRKFMVYYPTGTEFLWGVFVEPGAAPFIVSEGYAVGGADVSYSAAEASYVVVWGTESPVDIRIRLLDPLGNPRTPPLTVKPAAGSLSPPAAVGGDVNSLVLWHLQQHDVPYAIEAQRLVCPGIAVGPVERVCTGTPEVKNYDPVGAYDGLHYCVAWREHTHTSNSIWVDTLPCWQRHFYTSDPQATAYNQGRSLALDPATGYLHLVFRGEDGAVLYSYSTDNGLSWFPTEYVGQGCFPGVVCENQGPNPVWVCYQASIGSVEGSIVCKARVGPGQWIPYVVYSSEPCYADGPTMALRYCGLPSEGPGVYVGYRVRQGGSTAIMCNVVSLLGGVGPLETVESSSGPFLSTPTLATTPGDLAHCAWKVWHQDLGFERIQYKQRSTVGQWPQAAEDVSPWPDLPTEPASYPSVDAFGDRVYAAWRGMDLSVPPVSEAWRKERPLMGPPFDWTNPQNLSQSPGSESDYPQVSTPYAALFQEWRLFPAPNWDIWASINGVPAAFFESPTPSQYPDLVVEAPDPLHDDVVVHGVWTEGPVPGQSPPFEVMYQMRTYGAFDRGEEFSYYDCQVGDSARTRYCLSRDGCVRWRNYRLDVGKTGLRYRLPYLNPNCIYRVMAVLYQTGRDTWRQCSSLDGQPAGEVAYRPLVPETLWVTVPRELYRDDCAVELDVARLSGDYAVVAALKVYQFYPFREREGDLGDGQACRGTAEPRHGYTLAEPAPNPSGSNLSVAYSVPTAGAVAVRIYDAQGRLVSTLTSGPHSAGEHRASWDGRNAHGLRVATGTYFVRLESQSACLTRKAVLTR